MIKKILAFWLWLLVLASQSFALAQYLEVPRKDERTNLNLETNYLQIPPQNTKDDAKDLVDRKMLLKETQNPLVTLDDDSSVYVTIDDKKSIKSSNRAMINEYEKAQTFKKNSAETAKQDSDRELKIPFPKVGFKIDLGSDIKAPAKTEE